jgi:hypothetical protein
MLTIFYEVSVGTWGVAGPPRNRQYGAGRLVQWLEIGGKLWKPGMMGCIMAILTPGGRVNFDQFLHGTSQ